MTFACSSPCRSFVPALALALTVALWAMLSLCRVSVPAPLARLPLSVFGPLPSETSAHEREEPADVPPRLLEEIERSLVVVTDRRWKAFTWSTGRWLLEVPAVVFHGFFGVMTGLLLVRFVRSRPR